MELVFSSKEFGLRDLLAEYTKGGAFLLVDESVYQLFGDVFSGFGKKIFVFNATEKNKSLQSAEKIWLWLQESHARRDSTLVAVGGGITTDLGGFVASAFKRGIGFAAVPTTLLAMVDAAIGGKTAVNFGGLKNEIGSFYQPEKVFIDTNFLATLSSEAFFDGLAEVVKYGFIAEPELLRKCYKIADNNSDSELLKDAIRSSITIKQSIVANDLFDRGDRRKLNFGHTIGHALEEYSADWQEPISHGTAVAWGVLGELYLSLMKHNFPKADLLQYQSFLKENYRAISLSCKEFQPIIELIRHDKKSTSDSLNFTLLKSVGEALTAQSVEEKEIEEALDYMFL